MKQKLYKQEQLGFFPLYLSSIDYNFPQPKTTRVHGYHRHQIFLVSSGTGILKVHGNTYFLDTNDFFFLAADVPHEYYGNDSDFSTTYLSFFGDGFEGIKKYYGVGDYGVYKNKNKDLFLISVKNLFDSFDRTHEISTLCSLTYSSVIAYFDEAYKKTYDDIESVYKYLEGNYSKMITLNDILEVYPYSKAMLCRNFKAKYNMTIFEMINIIRLRHAQYMLTNYPHLKLKTIASSCGFNDVSFFCKMYKRMYNTTPKSCE